MKNTGVNLKQEELELQGDEYIFFGGESPKCLYYVPLDTREAYLPEGELQKGKDDLMDCVSRGYINILETKFTYQMRNRRMKSESMVWLWDNGYAVERNGKIFVEFSDRFIAIKSGTTREGNSMKAPAQAIHKFGLIPKKMFPREKLTWEDYHNPKNITKKMDDLGLEFLKRFAINYDQVFSIDLTDALAIDMVNLAGYAWPDPKDGEYPKTDGPFSHAFMAFGLPKTYIFDNYLDTDKDWIKKLAHDYEFYRYGYRIYVSAEYTSQDRSAIFKFVNAVKEILSGLFPPKAYDTLPEELPMNVEVPKVPSKSMIELWALAIQDFEGWHEGSQSYRNNNPGNIKGINGKFLTFKTYEEGFAYLCDYLTRAATGKHKGYSPEMTLYEFFKTSYAPDAEPIPRNYAAYVASKLAVTIDVKIKTLV